MDRPYFFTELREVYAIHGKNLTDGAVVSAIFRAVENFPNGFMDFVREKIADYTSLPSNLGRELRQELWPQFLEKYPQHKKQNQQNGCHQCSADVLGFFWAQGPDGMGKMFKCACNRQREFEHISGYTHAAVERQGYAIITDQGFYMRQVLAAMADDDATNKAVQIKPAMLSLQRVDREKEYRMRQLPDREQQAYAEAINV